jgi:magnesium-transporting ATPase (P-type)
MTVVISLRYTSSCILISPCESHTPFMTGSQRIHPVEGSFASFQSKGEKGILFTYQTAYKRHFVGTILYLLIMATFFGWFALQLVCTNLLYTTEGDDLLMSLRTFTAAWVVGYFWNCSLLWPHTIESLFLRRCDFAEATHIAVFQETSDESSHALNATKVDQSSRIPAFVNVIAAHVRGFAHSYFTLLFADPHCRPDGTKGIFQFCPVLRNSDNSQYIIFLLRRYNFNQGSGLYLAGTWAMERTFKDLAASKGITAVDEIEAAYEKILMEHSGNPQEQHFSSTQNHPNGRAVGPNVMEMDPPVLLRIFIDEIAKPFYLFQIYVVWIWACLEYVYGTYIIWTIVFMTACIISWFRFRGAQVLHALSHVTDKVTVIRDGKEIIVDQINLVPGDLVKVTPGIIHCDMLLLTGETVVDESALTGEATPQAKSRVDPSSNGAYDPASHKKQTLSAGTTIIECEDALALVMKTASYTIKGELLREVLVFRQHQIKFRSELPVVVSLLTFYSIIYCLVVMFTSNSEFVVALSLGM